VIAGGSLGVLWAASRATAVPDTLPLQGTEEDGFRAQQKIFEIARKASASRPRGQRTPQDVVLTEGEINAFMRRHLGSIRGASFDKLAVRLVGDGVAEIVGQVPVRQALGEGGATLADYLPESWRTAVVTVRLRGPLRLETEASPGQPKALRLQIEEAYVGRQQVPVTAVEWLLGAGRQLTRLPVPESVEGVTVERGRAVVRTLS
jgi:hypothetical protein